jgi:hypothetical protein
MDIVKKLIAGFGLGCLLIGTVIALVGLYLKGLELTIIGFSFIAVGIVVMESLHRKFDAFKRIDNGAEQDAQSPAREISGFTRK